MATIAREKGFWVREPLLDAAVDSFAVLGALHGAACELQPGDILLVTYAGHGCQVPGALPAVETHDQAWCLPDRLLRDNELETAWENFRPDVRIVVVSESCHSGTIAGPPLLPKLSFAAPPAFRAARDVHAERLAAEWGLADECRLLVLGKPRPENRIQASVIVLAASADEQTAREVNGVALFTAALNAVFREDQFSTYCGFIGEISRRVSNQREMQVPMISFAGIPNPAFVRERPFTI